MTSQASADNRLAKIVSVLKSMHRKLHFRKQITLANAGISVFIIGLFLLLILEHSLFLPASAKIVILLSSVMIAVLTSFFLKRKFLLPDFPSFYESFFKNQGDLKLLAAVDLYLDKTQTQSIFYQAALDANLMNSQLPKLSEELENNLRKSDINRLYRLLLLFSPLSLLSLVLFSVLNPETALRSLQPWHSFSLPNPYSYSISPSDTTVSHGTTLAFYASFNHQTVPGSVSFQFKTGVEDHYRERVMIRENADTFMLPGMELVSDISFRLVMDQFTGETYQIHVQQLPRFDELSSAVTFPEYTGLGKEVFQYPYSLLSVYPGSQIHFSGISNKDLENAELLTGDQTISMYRDVNNPFQFSTTLQPTRSDTLRFHLTDPAGLENRNPFRTIIDLREDQYPVVVIHRPTEVLVQENPEFLALSYQITDDFGLTRAELRYELKRAFVDLPLTGRIPLRGPVNGRLDQFSLELDSLDLRPRDQLEVRIRAWDNDEITGPKFSDSRPVLLRIPSLAESFDEIDSQERDLQAELDQISDNFSLMEEEYRQFLEKMTQNPDGGFEEEELLENVRERQQQISESVKKLTEQFDELRNRMESSNHVSDETRRAYNELQQLMDELDDPDLLEAIRALQEALQSMSQQELERAMENMTFNENLYRERLQRTAELFRQLKMNSDLNRIATQYEEMASRLKETNDEPVNLLNELNGMQEDFSHLEEQLQQLDSNPPRRAGERLRTIRREAERELGNIRQSSENLSDEAESLIESEQDSPSEEIRQLNEALQNRLSDEASRFRNASQQISGQQIQVNILALQQALNTLLEISELQEFLTLSAGETQNRNQGFVDLARIQNNLRTQFTRVADTLFQVSAELPGIPNQINRKKSEVERTLSRSLDQMVERNQRGSSVTARESLGGINDLASMISSLIDQIQNQQNGGMGSGMSMQQMIEQLQNMSGDQQMLNQQLQDLINDAQGERLTREQADRLDQLARQQNEIRRQLEELRQSGALRQGDRTLSDLQRTMEEMEDAINDMRGGITDPLMNNRQQNILSRMLSAEESLQQRGEEDEREGSSPTDYERVLPPDITLEELQQEIRSRLQDPNYTRFSSEYQRLIERYFERLRQLEESL
ncbi:MAG: hypothetical protein EA360_10655 [Balneolaceae bacterium]|nr:MAG: hypothetical protein EA360_10655 [Balneolaceae bacterium]